MSAPKKRAAAAEVFRQQNMMPRDEEEVIDALMEQAVAKADANFYQAQAAPIGGAMPASPMTSCSLGIRAAMPI